jgi:hypothetical protein
MLPMEAEDDQFEPDEGVLVARSNKDIAEQDGLLLSVSSTLDSVGGMGTVENTLPSRKSTRLNQVGDGGKTNGV